MLCVWTHLDLERIHGKHPHALWIDIRSALFERRLSEFKLSVGRISVVSHTKKATWPVLHLATFVCSLSHISKLCKSLSKHQEPVNCSSGELICCLPLSKNQNVFSRKYWIRKKNYRAKSLLKYKMANLSKFPCFLGKLFLSRALPLKKSHTDICVVSECEVLRLWLISSSELSKKGGEEISTEDKTYHFNLQESENT